MSEIEKILIADEDTIYLEHLSSFLRGKSYKVLTAASAKDTLDAFHSFSPDILLSELVFSDMDGYQLCKEIRRTSACPILVLSKKSEVPDKILALELGADDFLSKPFDFKELLARIRAILRRASHTLPENSDEHVEYTDLSVNLTNYSVLYKDTKIVMPPRELELLYFLAKSPNRVFTREHLLDRIWGYGYIGDTRTVDVHIRRIRQKLPPHPSWKINTVRGVGYKFEVQK